MKCLSAIDPKMTADDRNKVLGNFLNGLRIFGYGYPMRGIIAWEDELRKDKDTGQGKG